MNALLDFGNFYIDIISIVIVVLVFIAMIVGAANGFLKELVIFGRVFAILAVAILLCKPLGNWIYSLGAGEPIANAYEGWILEKNELLSTVVTESNREVIMTNGIEALAIPSIIASFLVKMINPYVPAEGGESIGKYMSVAFSHFTTQLIAFVALIILGAIVFAILKHFAKIVRKTPGIGGIDRFLGLVLSVVICYMIIDACLFGLSFLMVNSEFKISQWLSTTMLLDEPEAFTISKFIYEHSVIKWIIESIG